ncbi:CoA-substrate-specific enzyme activase [Methanosalsum zhilinae DSM 4017]|uniref:CoA-substrate-specific enzyme activase n=1 Tax=Methanosalsum zhilinae (strain DSM 4017 / NBRC 107636 / OCM 62 / WeN5) TaxID=679901 RepID=F7XP15_METZD|nr:acyl-CoA dehydratase activase [Methanosalsum zhilinae]AEH60209.1 CoA-substrate-specific enzyme activase [Methanosalsum zhilinae DSM 4017]
MISAGIDSGSATTKAVLVRDGIDVSHIIRPTAFDFISAAEKAYEEILDYAGIGRKDVDHVYSTGYGRESIKFADKNVSEITAHALGVLHLYPDVNGIIDIGGQDSKVISVNNGRVTDFLMNDKCAAGTGKFLEYTARALEVSIGDLGDLALASKKPADISSMCTVFAESEVISLRAKGLSKEDIAAGLIVSIARRVAVMARKISLKKNVAFVGGVAKNVGIKNALEWELGTELYVPPEPQITGALGAALYGSR